MAPRYIDVSLDKPRKLRFDVNALDALERATGAPLGEMIGLLARGSMRCLKLSIWQGLRHEDLKLSPDRVGELIQRYLEAGGSAGDLNDLVIEGIPEGEVAVGGNLNDVS